MTILQRPPHSGDRHAGNVWYRFGHADAPVRHTDAWEHETFAEEQARWERSDPEYAWICEEVRDARKRGGEASLRADQAKADWDARVATHRQANDDAQKAQHALKADQTARRHTASSREVSSPATQAPVPRARSHTARGDPRSVTDMHATFAIESNDSPAPGIIPEPVRVHAQPTAPTRRAGRRAAGDTTKPLFSPSQRNAVSIVLAKLMSAIRGTASPPEPNESERAAPAELQTHKR